MFYFLSALPGTTRCRELPGTAGCRRLPENKKLQKIRKNKKTKNSKTNNSVKLPHQQIFCRYTLEKPLESLCPTKKLQTRFLRSNRKDRERSSLQTDLEARTVDSKTKKAFGL